MGKASISIGVDDETGQPPSAPEGPYITDEDDGSRRDKRRSSGRKRDEPHPRGAGEDVASRRKRPAQP